MLMKSATLPLSTSTLPWHPHAAPYQRLAQSLERATKGLQSVSPTLSPTVLDGHAQLAQLHNALAAKDAQIAELEVRCRCAVVPSGRG
jgi:hypothetical protein